MTRVPDVVEWMFVMVQGSDERDERQMPSSERLNLKLVILFVTRLSKSAARGIASGTMSHPSGTATSLLLIPDSYLAPTN